jgi:hypothetical protein
VSLPSEGNLSKAASVEFGSSRSRPAESVIHVLLHNLEPALGSELTKIVQLRLGMLVNAGNADVQGCSFHRWILLYVFD